MKKFVSGLIIGSIITTSISTFAGGVWDKIDVLKNDINVMVDGKQIFADNFVYNDTTYLPLRVVAEVLGQKVTYNKATNTAYIGEKPVGSVDNSGVSNGELPDPLWIEKDEYNNVTNDEFQLPVYETTKDVKPYKCVSASDIADKANEITQSNRYCFLTDEFDISEYINFKEANTFLKCKSTMSLEEYYTTALPLLRALKQ